MISLQFGTMTINGLTWENIVTWSVWFQTPFGIFNNLEAAVKMCTDKELDPEISIIPVPVANEQEIVRR